MSDVIAMYEHVGYTPNYVVDCEIVRSILRLAGLQHKDSGKSFHGLARQF